MSDYELYHFGVKGMKWGVRKKRDDVSKNPYSRRLSRGFAGPGVYVGKKNKLEGYKNDLDYLNKGGHLSIGLTKKRQAAFDKRDKERLTKKIDELEKQNLDKGQDNRKAISDRVKSNLRNFAKKKISDLNAVEHKARRERIEELIYGPGYKDRKEHSPMDEKPHPNKTWTERPSRKRSGSI